MNIPEEAVEAAAEGAWTADRPGDAREWGVVSKIEKDAYRAAARAALEAAWAVMHPVLTTAEELDALPTGSTIRDKNGQAWQKVADSYWHAALWKQGNSSADVAAQLCPAVVLYRP